MTTSDREAALLALDDMPPPRARMRSTLIVLVIGVGIVLGALLTTLSALSAQYAADKMRDEILQDAADSAATLTEASLKEARPALEVARRLFQVTPACAVGRHVTPDDPAWRARAGVLLQIARAYSRLDGFCIGDAWGDAMVVFRDDNDDLRVMQFWQEHGRMRVSISRVDKAGRWTAVPTQGAQFDARPVASYDPRTRPWYRATEEAGDFAWTHPYTSPSSELVISAGLPLASVNGQVRAVVATDVLSSRLARRMRDMGSLPDSIKFICDLDGTLVAAPDLSRIPTTQGETAELPRAVDSGNPVVAAAARALLGVPEVQSRHELKMAPFDFSAAGRSYRGVAVQRDKPYQWAVVVVVPDEWGMGWVDGYTRLSVSGCILALVLCLVLALWIRRLQAQARGDRDLGSYHLEERLGEGPLGEVWRARHDLLARPAAVKLVPPERLGLGPLGERLGLDRLRRHARLAALLQSPHTAVLYDFGVSEAGTFYYVSELLDGIDLERLVGDYGAQPPARVVAVLEQVASALAEAHAIGLWHRHLKPGNVFLCRMGLEVDYVKVVDFGLVGRATPKEGRADDMRALGALGYWLLAGKAVVETSDESPPTLPPTVAVPEEVGDIIAACLDPVPERRPPADRVQEDLARLALSLPWSTAEAEAFWRNREALQGDGSPTSAPA